ncbi:MAG: hypothetical protein GY819_18390 [Planctomycetaceae bacterium]|nr:hypothetical protein [Planctomycetaceae bacterium]MCP4464766.1 hypothetical protein [Planctomycetaceae bacterium]MDG1810153.1 hypothetical protein [Pirellulaceae bacterium]MDG2105593.1 hypothetical protein [Pirellulaceae bacterium]
MGCSERQKEIKRRRQRKRKVAAIATRAKKASASEKEVLARKLRGLTPGAEGLIKKLEIEKS